MNFIRSPEGVIVGPASRSLRSQVASAVSSLSEPGAAIRATSILPSALMETDWMLGTLAKLSAGMGSGLASAKAGASAVVAATQR